MQLIAQTSVALVSVGSTCTSQVLYNAFLMRARDLGLGARVRVECMTFKAGFDPCTRLEAARAAFAARNFTLNRKCRVYEDAFYGDLDKMITEDRSTLDAARYLTGGDPAGKLGLLGDAELRWAPEKTEAFLERVVPLVDAYLAGLGELAGKAEL